MSELKELILELEKYKLKGQFQFSPQHRLSQVCNIPVKNDYSGLYLFYDIDKHELIYIGISGRTDDIGQIIHRKDGLRGRFLTGKQFGERRSISLPKQMTTEGITGLEIHWYVTYGGNSKDVPRLIEKILIETYKKENENKRPRWNKKD